MSTERIEELEAIIRRQCDAINAIVRSREKFIDEWVKLSCPYKVGQECSSPSWCPNHPRSRVVVRSVSGRLDKDHGLTWRVVATVLSRDGRPSKWLTKWDSFMKNVEDSK